MLLGDLGNGEALIHGMNEWTSYTLNINGGQLN